MVGEELELGVLVPDVVVLELVALLELVVVKLRELVVKTELGDVGMLLEDVPEPVVEDTVAGIENPGPSPAQAML